MFVTMVIKPPYKNIRALCVVSRVEEQSLDGRRISTVFASNVCSTEDSINNRLGAEMWEHPI